MLKKGMDRRMFKLVVLFYEITCCNETDEYMVYMFILYEFFYF